MNVREALTGQLELALGNFNTYIVENQFNEMSVTEIDYATETLRAWKRVCDGISPAAIRSVEYWGSLYEASRINLRSSGDGYLDDDASAELSWSESVLGGSEGALEQD